MRAAVLQSEAESGNVSDSVEMILEAHFDSFTKPYAESLISSWSESEGEGGLKKAILFFYRAANDPKGKFLTFLKSEFKGDYKDLEDKDLGRSYKVFDIISDHCTGNLKEASDPILRDCRVVSGISGEELEPQIGRYFKGALNAYLRENFSSLYEEVRNELSRASEGVAANDLMPSSSLSLLGASKLQDAAAKEGAREDEIAFVTEQKKGGGGRS